MLFEKQHVERHSFAYSHFSPSLYSLSTDLSPSSVITALVESFETDASLDVSLMMGSATTSGPGF